MNVRNLINILILVIWIILIPTISVLLDIYFNIDGIEKWLIVSIIALLYALAFRKRLNIKIF